MTRICKINIHMNAYIKLSCPYTLYKDRLLPSFFWGGEGEILIEDFCDERY